MSDDKLDFLEEGQDAPEAEAAETPEPQPEPEQPVEAAPEPDEGEQQEVAPPATPEPPQTIPVTALMDERFKRQEAERELQEIQRRMEMQERQLQHLQQPQQEAPDILDNPQGAFQHYVAPLQQQFEQRIMAMSLHQARQTHGEELVNEAIAFFDKNPQLSHQFVNHPSPYDAGVEFYKRQKVLEEIGADPDAWREQERAKLKAELNQAPAAPVQPKAPPPSMVTAPSQGGDVQAPGNAFDGMFPD